MKVASEWLAVATEAERRELDWLLSMPVDFRSFIGMASPRFEWYRAQGVIAGALERVARDELSRLMVFMPPQEGKSELVSRLFPAYYLTCHPDRWVGVGSYSFALAKGFSRSARGFYRGMSTESSPDEAGSIEQWNTGAGGGLWAVGRGGSATGRPAHLAIIDDPLKDRSEAESEAIRSTLHEWYAGVINMRFQPRNACVIVHCMTGDTRVLLADGMERALREIRPGDHVATYADGRLSTARVKNWRNQGSDCIFAIRTSSGITVRANARHPLLIDRGDHREWVQVKDLKIRDRVLRVIGENGGVSDVSSTGASARQRRRDIARRTTTRRSGRPDIDHHQRVRDIGGKHISGTDTGLISPDITKCWTPKTGDVRFAANFPEQMFLPNGAASSASITTLERETSAPSSVTAAILPWDTEKQNPSFSEQHSTCAIIPDSIIEIVEAGREDVFDIEVEGTANFIANGLVSHNTRWHEDDLAGHLLALERAGDRPERWTVIELPGIAEEPAMRPEYPSSVTVVRDWRQPGEPLGGRYGPERYEQIRVVSGSREYEAQVQQRPAPSKGTIFQRGWWKRYRAAPKRFDRVIISVDCAFKDADDSDFVAIHVYGRLATEVWLLERVHQHLSFTATKEMVARVMRSWPHAVVYIEDKANGSAVIDTLRFAFLSVIPVEPEGGKVARAYACQGDVEQGRVWLPEDGVDPLIADMIREAASFPSAPHDDDVDAFTQAMAVFRVELRMADQEAPRKKPKDDIQGPLTYRASNPAQEERPPLFEHGRFRVRVHPPRPHQRHGITIDTERL